MPLAVRSPSVTAVSSVTAPVVVPPITAASSVPVIVRVTVSVSPPAVVTVKLSVSVSPAPRLCTAAWLLSAT